MKRFAFPGAFLVLIALSLAFAACGDDKDKNQGPTPSDGATAEIEVDPNIRTSKGLTVSAVNAGFGNGSGTGISSDDSAMAGSLGGASSGQSMAAPKSAGDSYSGGNSSGNAQAAESGGGLTVTGYGTATAPADSAIIEFYFNTNNNYGYGTPSPGTPITEETLQPIADALVAIGVAAEDIEFVSQGYYDAYYSSGSIRAIARDVTAAEAIAQAVGDASGSLGNNITLSSTNITYTLEDCEALEAAATRTAAEDAADNADRLAGALGLSAGSITAASDYSYPWYYPYFGEQTCGSSYYGPIAYYAADGATGAIDDQPKEVQVFANINVTYAIR